MKRAGHGLQGVGVGFKPRHYEALMELPPAISWLEVHAENYMVAGGETLAQLRDLAQYYPISVHGVGLSLAGQAAPDPAHLARLKQLIDWLKPAQISEHLAWSSHGGVYFNDLLPISYDQPNFQRLCQHIDQVQQALGRAILIENPANYLSFSNSACEEVDFLSALASETGCGLLLDINNVYVSAQNQQWDAMSYLYKFDYSRVGEIHLAGFASDTDALGHPLLIDNHGAPIDQRVWQLFDFVCQNMGAFPTLIERDNNIPPWPEMLAEAQRAGQILAAAADQLVRA